MNIIFRRLYSVSDLLYNIFWKTFQVGVGLLIIIIHINLLIMTHRNAANVREYFPIIIIDWPNKHFFSVMGMENV